VAVVRGGVDDVAFLDEDLFDAAFAPASTTPLIRVR